MDAIKPTGEMSRADVERARARLLAEKRSIDELTASDMAALSEAMETRARFEALITRITNELTGDAGAVSSLRGS